MNQKTLFLKTEPAASKMIYSFKILADLMSKDTPGAQEHLKHRYWFLTVVVQSLSRVQFPATPWMVGSLQPQASLSFTVSLNLLKLMSTESVTPSNHLILCHSLLLLPSTFPSIRVFSNESAFHIRWPKYWSICISPSNEYSGLNSFRIDKGTWHT